MNCHCEEPVIRRRGNLTNENSIKYKALSLFVVPEIASSLEYELLAMTKNWLTLN